MNFSKTRIIAIREYLAAVKSKSFLISLVLLPVLMTGGIWAQKLGKKIGDTSTYRIALVDNSPGAALTNTIQAAVKQHNEHDCLDSTGRQIKGKFELQQLPPVDWKDAAALDQKRLELSDRVRSGELLAFVEIGPAVLTPAKSDTPEAGTIRYSTNRPTYTDFMSMLQTTMPAAVIQKRFTGAAEDFKKIQPLLAPTPVVETGLAEASNGKIGYQTKSGQVVGTVVPLVMILMMFMVTLIGTSPISANVVEEKQLRIAEVLLGCVSPFELMFGKLIGGAAVSLTLAALFFSGAFYIAHSFDVARYVTVGAIAWFFFFTVIGTFMYGALFVAAGAACSNIKEVQSFIMPVMLCIALPMFVLGPMLENPSGPLGMALSFFPLSSPMAMVLRLNIPPGIPIWQALLAAVITLIATTFLIWTASRIFRVGILMQGKGANYATVTRWILRG